MTTQKLIVSTSHLHGWASEYPRAYQEYFLMDPELIALVEGHYWERLAEHVTRVWTDIRMGYANPEYPVCTDAIPNLKIIEVPTGTKFILNEVPFEHIVILNDDNVITANF